MALDSYDPDLPPRASEWLALDEDERLALVLGHHARARIRLPNERLHAALHVVVENQLALGESAVVETLARLQSEGLSRHDALHAIASAATSLILDLASGSADTRADAMRIYAERLRELTARSQDQ